MATLDDIQMFDRLNRMLRDYFSYKLKWTEVSTQSQLSILAACEAPKTVVPFVFAGQTYPLPQTGQMRLEDALLRNPSLPGVFCQTTSYRDEPDPIPGRHDLVFPMFEFEGRGNFADLMELLTRLVQFLGFDTGRMLRYSDACARYGYAEITAEYEELIGRDYGRCTFLYGFPQRTHPFWNMKDNGDGTFAKVDVLLYGMETIGCAERSVDLAGMRANFMSISDGRYAKLLFARFGRERVMDELDEYLSLPMAPRFGAGIGMTRLARAVRLRGCEPPAAPPAARQT